MIVFILLSYDSGNGGTRKTWRVKPLIHSGRIYSVRVIYIFIVGEPDRGRGRLDRALAALDRVGHRLGLAGAGNPVGQ